MTHSGETIEAVLQAVRRAEKLLRQEADNLAKSTSPLNAEFPEADVDILRDVDGEIEHCDAPKWMNKRIICGVRVEGDKVIINMKGGVKQGNRAARLVCGEILKQMESRSQAVHVPKPVIYANQIKDEEDGNTRC